MLVGCSTTMAPDESGVREFDRKLTRQSIHDMDGGVEPIEGLGIALGSRVEHHFTNRLYDFNNNHILTTGYLESGEYESTLKESFSVVKNTYRFIEIEYTSVWGERITEKLYKTLGCYYLKRPMGFKEYYCKKAKKI